jgi:hypothetical protein
VDTGAGTGDAGYIGDYSGLGTVPFSVERIAHMSNDAIQMNWCIKYYL